MFGYLETVPRVLKRLIFLAADLASVPVALYIAFELRFGTSIPYDQVSHSLWLFLLLPICALPIIWFTGANRVTLIAFTLHDIRSGIVTTVLLMISAMVISYLFQYETPRSIPLIFGPVFLVLHIGTRLCAQWVLLYLRGQQDGRTPVVIYGAGSAGVQLLAAIRQDFKMQPIAFIDDNLILQKMTVSGLPVFSKQKLADLAAQGKVKRVLLALPSESDAVRRKHIQEIYDLGCEVLALPSYAELTSGTGFADNLKLMTPDMLLGRDKVELGIPEIERVYAGRNILITGAGGSIGAELCRQIVRRRPDRLVLFDHSEYALYSIDQELRPIAKTREVELIAKLGNVCDRMGMDQVLAENDIDIVLHAAAYKHVPLVENNEIEGVKNNVLGTLTAAKAARAAKVERFILVSTDKAVRPTNIMGATKRLAELVVQDLQTRADSTKFTMVRFGNVLGSSGSVIPLFQKQIAAGGPITLTHEDITRYFMTIPEAARLVLLAGAYTTGGDVFVLDMGEPVKVKDLATRMIELSGAKVADGAIQSDGITIDIIGLRPGEKLHEELLIGKNTLPTPHDKILRAQEGSLSQIEVAHILKRARSCIEARDLTALRQLIAESVDGYHVEPASQATTSI